MTGALLYIFIKLTINLLMYSFWIIICDYIANKECKYIVKDWFFLGVEYAQSIQL